MNECGGTAVGKPAGDGQAEGHGVEHRPQPTEKTTPQQVAWLIADGAGHTCIKQHYIPMAGHVLGYHLQPHEHLNLASDLERALDLLRAKQVGEGWLIMGQHALTRFCRFMQTERGFTPQLVTFKQANVTHYHDGLPGWLVEQLTQLQHIRQANWRPSRLNEAILRFWSVHTRLWRWLFAHEDIQAISDIKRAHLFAYIDERLDAGYTAKSVNQELRAFQATLYFLQERDFAVPRALLRLPGLKEPDSLPRFLTDEQVGRLQADLEQRVAQADSATGQRNALLDRAAFYLLWQGGLRLGEAEELRLDDLNLAQKQLLIRQGKGRKDRAVYLTDRAIAALQAYLTVRGNGASVSLPAQAGEQRFPARPHQGGGGTNRGEGNAAPAAPHLCHAAGQCGLQNHHDSGAVGAPAYQHHSDLRPRP